MTHSFIALGNPEVFPAFIDSFPAVQLNPHKDKFLILYEPSTHEIREAIEEHAHARMEGRWEELNEALMSGALIAGFSIQEKRFTSLPHDAILNLLGTQTFSAAKRKLAAATLDEQRAWLAPLKPKSIELGLATFRDGVLDQTGYRYFNEVLRSSSSGFEFFKRIIDSTFERIAETDYRLGTPKVWAHQPRIFELLAIARRRNWLLFPFIAAESGMNFQYSLMHAANVKRYTDSAYSPPFLKRIIEMANGLVGSLPNFAYSSKYLIGLAMSTDIFDVAQISEPLLTRGLALVDNKKEDSHRQVQYCRTAYNATITLYNSLYHSVAPIDVLIKESSKPSLETFADFSEKQKTHPHLANWCERMSQYLRQKQGASQGLSDTRRHLWEILEFLSTLSKAPSRPEFTRRQDINNYTTEGSTFRNYIAKQLSSPETKNTRLYTFKNFLDFVRDSMIREHRGAPADRPWFENPIDILADTFKQNKRTGSTRKSIPAAIMELARQILIENDYAWPKTFTADWTVASDSVTGEMVNVWCPSAASCLYTLLTLPLRSVQARMADSGAGDSLIFDFKTKQMVPNPRVLPVDGRIDPKRKEGFLQILASGLSLDPDVVGLWIPINKSKDAGYPIPWVSDELLKQIEYQHNWNKRYLTSAKAWGVDDAQGYRNLPEGEEIKKIFPIFPDAAGKRGQDPTLPIAKQKILKMWGRLCLEVETRMNNRATERIVTLARVGPQGKKNPVAIHDIHSLRVSGVTDLLERGVPIDIVQEYIVGHDTRYMTASFYNRRTWESLRAVLDRANKSRGKADSPIAFLAEPELEAMRPHLISMVTDSAAYTGFDALEENQGLASIRIDGICPGTRCEEGGLNDNGDAIPVPHGDRGPSCPQCRFNLSGPAFLLGQVIEGNKLIFKIRKKVVSLVQLREKVLDAEDKGTERERGLAEGRARVEEAQLNDMLTEWWHRMRIYEDSLKKLPGYEAARDELFASKAKTEIVVDSDGRAPPLEFGYTECHPLELTHFLSTTAELLPEDDDTSLSAHQDVELAIGKFFAIAEEEMLSHYFKLPEGARLTAANLAMEVLFNAAGSPEKVQKVLDGQERFQLLPETRQVMFDVLSQKRKTASNGAELTKAKAESGLLT